MQALKFPKLRNILFELGIARIFFTFLKTVIDLSVAQFYEPVDVKEDCLLRYIFAHAALRTFVKFYVNVVYDIMAVHGGIIL